MALILGDGFDHYADAHIINKWDGVSNSGGGTQAVGLAYGRLGSQGLRAYGAGNYNLVKNLPAQNAGFGYVGAAVYVPNFSTLRRCIFTFQDMGGGVAGNSQLVIGLENDGAFSLRPSYDGSLIAVTPPGRMAAGAWYYVESKVKIHSTSGAVEIRVNESVVYSATGLNTRRQGSGNDWFSRIGLGGSEGSAPSWELTYFDDFYYCDDQGSQNNSYLGDVQLQAIYPNGVGHTTQWIIDGSVPVATNWQGVSEHPPNDDVTYNRSNTVGHTDMFEMEDISSTSTDIKGLLINNRVMKDDATARQYASMVKDVLNGGADTQVAVRTTPYGAFTNQQDVSELNPTTGLPWTAAQVNAMRAGIKVIS